MENGETGAGVLLAVVLIWSGVGVLLLLWYLWAMARLFPKLGLPAGQGWIPLWNDWKLMDRAGLPGWTVILYLVGLGLVPIIIRIMAMHRVNREAGVGVGYTVLGAFIPPLWATMLGSILAGRVLATKQPATTDASFGAWSAAAAAGAAAGGASVAAAPLGGFVQPAPPVGAGFVQPAPPVGAGFVQPAPPVGAGFTQPAPPVAGGYTNPVQPYPATAPGSTPWAADADLPQAQPVSAAPAAPFPEPQHSDPNQAPVWGSGGSGQPVDQQFGAQPPAPGPLGTETEAEYARLAAESFEAPPSVPLGQAAPPEPFSWSAATRSEPAPVEPPAPVFPEPLPEPFREQAQPSAPVVPPAPAAPPAPAVAFSSAPTPATHKPTGITGQFDPLPENFAQPAETTQGDSTVVSDFDRTVLVPRNKTDWVLVLPDGSRLPLEKDTIVGRKPEAVEGATALIVPDATRTLSKSHARLRYDGNSWTIEDLASTNGVVLISPDGTQTTVSVGAQVPATQRMLIGTLEVQLTK